MSRLMMVFCLGVVLFANANSSVAVERYVPGTHYALVKDMVAPALPGKVTLFEFFSYGCPHCASLAPLLQKFHDAAPDYVVWKRFPAMWSKRFLFYAGVYRIMDTLGWEDKYHNKMFAAIHSEHLIRESPTSVVQWFKRQGEDTTQFEQLINDNGWLGKQLSPVHLTYQKFKVMDVPTFVVDGRYIVASGMAADQLEFLKILEFLVTKAASERKDVKVK